MTNDILNILLFFAFTGGAMAGIGIYMLADLFTDHLIKKERRAYIKKG
tara:strand:- start:2039 stop:2182 length:144 start_codon:yes stop_codon:yes gene_type:complete